MVSPREGVGEVRSMKVGGLITPQGGQAIFWLPGFLLIPLPTASHRAARWPMSTELCLVRVQAHSLLS